MRLDKFLKVARIIKRRSVASSACSSGHVMIGDKTGKPGSEVKPGDILTLRFGERQTRYEVLDTKEVVSKEDASDLYRVLP